MLEVKNLWVSIAGDGEKEILKGVNLRIREGETHALLGPNACGKSTLAMAILGYPQYKVKEGSIHFDGKNLAGKSIYERAKLGIALAYQNPPAVRGVKMRDVIRFSAGKSPWNPLLEKREEFSIKFVKRAGLDASFSERDVNLGFSGGEKKKSELAQIFALRPKLIDRNATYIENFIILAPCLSDQAYPTAVLRGDNSRAVIRTIALGLKSSDIDVGSALIFSGENTRGELVSRTVATDKSNVKMRGTMKGYSSNAKGHLECRGMLLSETARARAYPQLRSTSPGVNLTHEAAIGKIAEEDLYYLMSRKMSEQEATSMITRGFLDVETPGFPLLLRHEINRVVSMSLEEKVL